jgi:hypothetical protein
MDLWSVFVTGLFAGGASCAAVQGGLLVASVVHRGGHPAAAVVAKRPRPPRLRAGSKQARRKQKRARARYDHAAARRRAGATSDAGRLADDVVPVGGFLAGKLASHTGLGFVLGLFGSSVQLSYQSRAALQIMAGLFMVLVAAHLAGVPAWAGWCPSRLPG